MARKKKLVEGVDYTVHKPASEKHEMILANNAQILVIGGAMGGGKQTDIMLPVHTPDGTKLLRDVEDGDTLLNPEGGTSKVLKAHPITAAQVYRMTFEDGTVVDACKDHRWYGSWRNDKQSPFARWDNEGCVKTTLEVFKHYENFPNVKRKRFFRIPLTTALEYTTKELAIDPYLLGCLLGDSYITGNQVVTHKDDLSFFQSEYDKLNIAYYAYPMRGDTWDIRLKKPDSDILYGKLEDMSLAGTKFIPEQYLHGNIDQRYALLQGMMDTDGSIDECGETRRHRLKYSTTSDKLKEGFCRLASSLGYSVIPKLRPAGNKVEKNGTIYKCVPCWQIEIKSRDDSRTFRLPRKADKVTKSNYQPSSTLESIKLLDEYKPMRCLTVDHPNALYVVGDGCIVTHNTYLQQMLGLRYIDDPNTAIVTFRRTMDEIKGQGGVWDTANDIFGTLHPSIRPKSTFSRLTYKFPSGATAVYKGMELVKDARKNQGLQFTLCNFDEGTLFEWEQIEYLFQRMRSGSKYKSRIVISCNPDPDHKIAELVDWYLDEEGYPDPSKEGTTRYFVRKGGEFVWGSSREELGEKFDIPKEKWESTILSFSFIGCTIEDNPIMRDNNPEYVAFLEGMNEVDKARNLYGNWYARAEGAKLWKRQWVCGESNERVRRYADIPTSIRWYRGWDKGYSVPSEKNKYPDYSACSPKIGKDAQGMYWIVGDYQHATIDDNQRELKENDKVFGQFRKLAGERDVLLTAQAKFDGDDCSVVLTKDLGAGTTDHTYTKSKLVENGVKVVEDNSHKNTPDKKIKDFLPFCNACELGLVYIVEESFNKATLQHFYKQLEAFSGERSTSARKDDVVDATALGFNAATTTRTVRIVVRNQQNSPSLAVGVLDNHTVSERGTLEEKGININDRY